MVRRIPGLSTIARVLLAAVVVAGTVPVRLLRAQDARPALVQIEVRDSVGLPLPDAAVEVFTVLEGGVFWEWVRVGAADLPEGINLLRFSYPGYEPSTFSVPLRNGSVVSLRVRLMAERDSAKRATSVDARILDVVGLALEGRMKTDIIGHRRVIDHAVIELDATRRFGPLMRRARNTELNVIPATQGTFRVGAQGSGGRCSSVVMVNGDRRKVLPFPTFDQLYGTSELEAIEIFPRGVSIPNAYQVTGARCGLMVVWFKLL